MQEEKLESFASPAAPGRDLLENHRGAAPSRANQRPIQQRNGFLEGAKSRNVKEQGREPRSH